MNSQTLAREEGSGPMRRSAAVLRRTRAALWLGLIFCPAGASLAAQTNTPALIEDAALVAQAELAIRRGLDWLRVRQRDDGAWSSPRFPALTALPLMCFAREAHPQRDAVLARARAFLLRNVQEDGGIYHKSRVSVTGGLTTYNTAICMSALRSLNDPELTPVLLKARAFLAAAQQSDGSERDGGFGYNRKGFMSRPDLNNTTAAMEAMRVTADLEDLRPAEAGRVDIRWDAASAYVARLQVDPAQGGDDAGGFQYAPSDPKAGARAGQDGEITFRAYGSMTYSGLLALLHASVARDDARVRSAFDWAARHWTVKENPGMGAKGLFFFYNVLSKALHAYGADAIPRQDGPAVRWREELVRTLVARQIVDEAARTGYWVNAENKRFLEGDEVLVTAYAILALQNALGRH